MEERRTSHTPPSALEEQKASIVASVFWSPPQAVSSVAISLVERVGKLIVWLRTVQSAAQEKTTSASSMAFHRA